MFPNAHKIICSLQHTSNCHKNLLLKQLASLRNSLPAMVTTSQKMMSPIWSTILNWLEIGLPTFMPLLKVHKTPWQTHPRIISVSGSALYGVGKWLDQQLQPFLKQLPTNISSSYDLINKIWTRCRAIPFSLIAQCSLFTGDNFQCTQPLILMMLSPKLLNILTVILTAPTATCRLSSLHFILSCDAIAFVFGDTYGSNTIAMGAPPAPLFASPYYGIYELDLYLEFGLLLHYPKWFIDDQFGIWRHHPDPIVDRQKWAALF